MDRHWCHWPGCEQQIPPRLWGCGKHWGMLPKHLQTKILDAYRYGQEISKTPSCEYIAAAREARNWIMEHCQPKAIK